MGEGGKADGEGEDVWCVRLRRDARSWKVPCGARGVQDAAMIGRKRVRSQGA